MTLYLCWSDEYSNPGVMTLNCSTPISEHQIVHWFQSIKYFCIIGIIFTSNKRSFCKNSKKRALKLMTLLKAAVPHRDNDDVIRKVAVGLVLAFCSYLFISTLICLFICTSSCMHHVDFDEIDVDKDAS